MLGMHRRIGPVVEPAEVTLLNLDEVLFVLRSQALENGWVDNDAELKITLVPRALLEDFAQLALDFHAHGLGALHLPLAFAVEAVVIDRRAHAFAVALAGHFHQAKLR